MSVMHRFVLVLTARLKHTWDRSCVNPPLEPLMRRTALAAVLLAAASTFASAPSANACVGFPCDQINRVCALLGGGGCLP